ncbi:MAG TPA: ABC transporter permease [Nocardioides sp.]|nr:ABC transporter permease [Nocardioides sp.]
MSTLPLRTLDVSGTRRVPFSRLVRTESRKLVDTRGGLWLLGISSGLLLLVFGIVLLVCGLSSSSPAARDWLSILTIPVAMLVPVLAITIVTQEWGQRTAMTTFCLEPSRLRVILAKLVSVTILGVATILLALVLVPVGNVLGAGLAGSTATWNITTSDIVIALLTQVLYLLMGFGLGLLLLSSPGALAIYYVYGWILEGGVIIPGIMYVLWIATGWGHSLFPWISMRIAMLPFGIDDSTRDDLASHGLSLDTGALGIAHIVTSVLLWVGLPLGLGMWRVLRAELK